jgi:Skp family chaperone for outer membrane proteins
MFVKTKRIVHTIILSGLITVSLTACDQTDTANPKVAYVDMSVVLKDSVLGKQEAEHNQQVKDRLLGASKEAEVQYKNMPMDQQAVSRKADAEILNREWQAGQKRARMVSIQSISNAVEAYRQKQKLDMVLSAEYVISANKERDVTQQIIAQLATSHIDYGTLPEITTKNINQPTVKE